MKILGVGNGKYICEIDDDELFDLVGSDKYDEDFDVNPGDEVDLKRVIRSARWIRDLDNDHIEGIINGMRTVLVGMERVKDTAGALNLFNKIRNAEEEVK